METRSLATLVVLEERGGYLDRALELAGELRKAEPRNLAPTLDYARLAARLERWDQAEDALNWAILTHPEEPRPRSELVDLYLRRGDLSEARRALSDLERLVGDTPEVERFRQRVISGHPGRS
jgi:Flp pilus assembly protein TadD